MPHPFRDNRCRAATVWSSATPTSLYCPRSAVFRSMTQSYTGASLLQPQVTTPDCRTAPDRAPLFSAVAAHCHVVRCCIGLTLCDKRLRPWHDCRREYWHAVGGLGAQTKLRPTKYRGVFEGAGHRQMPKSSQASRFACLFVWVLGGYENQQRKSAYHLA